MHGLSTIQRINANGAAREHKATWKRTDGRKPAAPRPASEIAERQALISEWHGIGLKAGKREGLIKAAGLLYRSARKHEEMGLTSVAHLLRTEAAAIEKQASLW